MYLIIILVLSIEKRNASSNDDSLTFPLKDSLAIYDRTEIDVVNNSIKIPESLIEQRSGMLIIIVYIIILT